jgi:nickel transport protein
VRVGILAVALAAAVALPASAHEVLHEVRPGGAVAVRVFHSDGEPLASAPYEVWSPADPGVAWQKGRTDREGWLAFVPAAPGAWRVKVIGDDGHGLETVIDTTALASLPTATPGSSSIAAAPRLVVGVALVALLFGALVLLARRRKAP